MQTPLEAIAAAAAGLDTIRLMEVCGTHTMALFRSGLRALLPANVKLLSGPGCPVCVTAQGYLDAAVALALRGLTICTYGDMVRVPGEGGSLAEARAKGAKVVVVYSALDALRYASEHPAEEVVFLAVGFETTTPGSALLVREATRLGVANLSLLVAHKLVVPAMLALLDGGPSAVDGFILPGHVSLVIGVDAYRPVVERHTRPCVVAGFEAPSMLRTIQRLVEAVAAGRRHEATATLLASEYRASPDGPSLVSAEGNLAARSLVDDTFVPADAVWRAIGRIPLSGLRLRDAYAHFDAARRYGVDTESDSHLPGCRCGEVIQGLLDPPQCALFRGRCTPLDPVGPCMVSSEGTCAAWYKYAGGR